MFAAPEIRVLRERCVACGDCLKLCPHSGEGVTDPVLVIEGDPAEVVVKNRRNCISCHTCVEYCRATAIFISGDLKPQEDQPAVLPSRPLNRIV